MNTFKLFNLVLLSTITCALYAMETQYQLQDNNAMVAIHRPNASHSKQTTLPVSNYNNAYEFEANKILLQSAQKSYVEIPILYEQQLKKFEKQRICSKLRSKPICCTLILSSLALFTIASYTIYLEAVEAANEIVARFS